MSCEMRITFFSRLRKMPAQGYARRHGHGQNIRPTKPETVVHSAYKAKHHRATTLPDRRA